MPAHDASNELNPGGGGHKGDVWDNHWQRGSWRGVRAFSLAKAKEKDV